MGSWHDDGTASAIGVLNEFKLLIMYEYLKTLGLMSNGIFAHALGFF